MPRPPRQLLDHGCYHLMARGNNRQRLFTKEAAFRYFLALLGQGKARYPARLYHYCLMSNHIHLLLEIETGAHLPKFMQPVLQGYGRWCGKGQDYCGRVWPGRDKSPRIARESYYLEAGRDIERNPLRAKLVKELQESPWSSYGFYACGLPDALVDTDPYDAQLGQTTTARQAAYRDFVRLESPHTTILDTELVEAPC